MRVPLNVLRKIRSECSNFAVEESGVGISDYGALFALLMMAAGFGAGWYFLSGAPGTTPVGGVKMLSDTPSPTDAVEWKFRMPGFREPCPGCGGG